MYTYTDDCNTEVDPRGLNQGKAIISQYKNGLPEEHFTIQIQTQEGWDLNTHQLITSSDHSSTKIINNITGLGEAPYELVHSIEIDLSDADAALKHQKELMKISDLRKYDVLENSCLSHITDVLEKGDNTPLSKSKLGYAIFLRKHGFNLIGFMRFFFVIQH